MATQLQTILRRRRCKISEIFPSSLLRSSPEEINRPEILVWKCKLLADVRLLQQKSLSLSETPIWQNCYHELENLWEAEILTRLWRMDDHLVHQRKAQAGQDFLAKVICSTLAVGSSQNLLSLNFHLSFHSTIQKWSCFWGRRRPRFETFFNGSSWRTSSAAWAWSPPPERSSSLIRLTSFKTRLNKKGLFPFIHGESNPLIEWIHGCLFCLNDTFFSI